MYPDDEVTVTDYVAIGPPSRITWLVPALLLVAVLLAIASDGCGLDTGSLGAPGHRVDPAPTVVVRDDDGGSR